MSRKLQFVGLRYDDKLNLCRTFKLRHRRKRSKSLTALAAGAYVRVLPLYN
jgi:hypothetical protein